MQDNIDSQLRSRYKSEQMRKILASSLQLCSRSFITNGGVRSPYFYESNHAIVFPPCSDTEGTGMETITQILTQAKPHLTEYADKCFVFPLVEERGVFLSWGPKRMHWVTLHFDPKTRIATVIDSRPSLVSYWYICQPIHDFLNAGLQALDLPPVKKFNVVYQWVQHDDIHCGAWTAANIEGLADGHSVETQLSCLSSQERDAIVQHHIDRIYHKKSQSYLAVRSPSTTSSADTVLLEDDEDDYAVIANSPLVMPPMVRQGSAHDSLDDPGEEDDFLQGIIDVDSDREEEPIVDLLLQSTHNVSDFEHIIGRGNLELAYSEPSQFTASGLVPPLLPLSNDYHSISSQSSVASMVTVQLETPTQPTATFVPPLELQGKPGSSDGMLHHKPTIRVPLEPPKNRDKRPLSACFYLQCLFGLLGGVSLAFALILCIPALAASMGIVLGATTSKIALGAGVVSGLSFAASGLLFYCRPNQRENEDISSNSWVNSLNMV